MRIRPGILMAIVAVFVILFSGRFLGWFGSKTDTAQNGTPTPTETLVDVPAPSPSALPSDSVAGNTRPVVVPRQPAPTPNVSAAPTTAPPQEATGVITEWEQKVDQILTIDEDEAQKSQRLLNIFSRLPEDGQVEVAQHLSNLLPDENYSSLATTLTNAHTAEAVLDVLMTDVLNRPNVIKLPALLDVARAQGHPKAEEARDILEVFVDENYGENWSAWDEAIKKWLKENPE